MRCRQVQGPGAGLSFAPGLGYHPAKKGSCMLDDRYALREPEVALEAFDGEAILIDFRSGSYYSLSPLASEIVMGLGAHRSPQELTSSIEARYPDAGERVSADLCGLVQRLLEDGVIVPAPTNAEAPAEAPASESPPPAGDYQPPEVERFEDMQEMLLLDPIHDVDLAGWPVQRPADEPPA